MIRVTKYQPLKGARRLVRNACKGQQEPPDQCDYRKVSITDRHWTRSRSWYIHTAARQIFNRRKESETWYEWGWWHKYAYITKRAKTWAKTWAWWDQHTMFQSLNKILSKQAHSCVVIIVLLLCDVTQACRAGMVGAGWILLLNKQDRPCRYGSVTLLFLSVRILRSYTMHIYISRNNALWYFTGYIPHINIFQMDLSFKECVGMSHY